MSQTSLNFQGKRIIESANPIQEFRLLSGACEYGTEKFLKQYNLTLNSEISKSLAVKLLAKQTFYRGCFIENEVNLSTKKLNLLATYFRRHYGSDYNKDEAQRLAERFFGKDFYKILSKNRKNAFMWSAMFSLCSKELEQERQLHIKRMNIQFVKDTLCLDKKIRDYKKISGSTMPLSFAHSILIKEGLQFLPKLARMFDAFHTYIQGFNWSKLSYLNIELYCGRERRTAALKELGFSFPSKDPDYIEFKAIHSMIEERIDKLEKEIIINEFYYFLSDKERRYVRNSSLYKCSEVLKKFCTYYGMELPAQSVGVQGKIAKQLLSSYKEKTFAYSTK